MNISVCIPSYKRPKVETLDVYPNCRVYVAESEFAAYRASNGVGADIVAVPDEVQGNAARIRNYILDVEFEAGADGVLLLDDDMSAVRRFEAVQAKHGLFGYQAKDLNEAELLAFVRHGFELCDEWGFKLWGVNCVKDPRSYCAYTPFSTNEFIGGPFSGHLRNPLRYDERLPLKEDYDLLLQHCNKYRGVLRFNAYHYDCKQSDQAGGCAQMRNLARERQQFEALQRKWGADIVKSDGLSKKTFDYNPRIKVPIRGV